ncbi:hypothetical protein RCL1_008200 [Eukaryota sp. TZLM3-RCL]
MVTDRFSTASRDVDSSSSILFSSLSYPITHSFLHFLISSLFLMLILSSTVCDALASLVLRTRLLCQLILLFSPLFSGTTTSSIKFRESLFLIYSSSHPTFIHFSLVFHP